MHNKYKSRKRPPLVRKAQGGLSLPAYYGATGDITSLYTNMDIKRSIDEVAEIFPSHPDPKRPDEAILYWILPYGLMISSLQVNFFLQVLGTAMGKRFAPNLANFILLNLTKRLFLIL